MSGQEPGRRRSLAPAATLGLLMEANPGTVVFSSEPEAWRLGHSGPVFCAGRHLHPYLTVFRRYRDGRPGVDEEGCALHDVETAISHCCDMTSARELVLKLHGLNRGDKTERLLCCQFFRLARQDEGSIHRPSSARKLILIQPFINTSLKQHPVVVHPC